MKHLVTKLYRNPELIKKIVNHLEESNISLKIMEVCGSHTMAIGHWGIRKLLPERIKLISGPGCPVCVTPSAIIDILYEFKDITIATFGDLLKVPGKKGSLEKARAEGLDIRIIYSPLEALKIAETRETILVGIGFETTIPGIAYTIKMAKEKKMKNFSVLSSFKTVPNALDVLLSSGDVELDGFLLPGHVSSIIGVKPYDILVKKHRLGGVIAGFEPIDILSAIKILMEQKRENKPEIINEYKRVVTNSGNIRAQAIINEVLEERDALWRGIGWIPKSGLAIRKEYSEYDASVKYGVSIEKEEEPTACRCGDVLKGKILPDRCGLFGKKCIPSNPMGPCMVSSEGSCAAYYKYERN